MVSRVDVNMYSMASAIKDPSTSSMSWKHLLRLKTEAPVPKKLLYIQASPASGGSVDFTGNHTQVYQIAILLGMARTVQNIPQDKELQL